MAWFKKDEAPPELQGLTPEEIAAAVKKSKELETTTATQQTQITDLQAKASELDTVKARLAEIEANSRRDNPPRRTDPTSVLVDEDTAFRERLAPTHQALLNTAASVARMEVRSGLKARDRYIWDKYQTEIESLMANDVRKSQAAGWLAALTYVKGLHTEDITKPEFFSELGGESEIGGTRNEPKKADKLTDEELGVCLKMGIKEEDYLAQKKAMVAVNA